MEILIFKREDKIIKNAFHPSEFNWEGGKQDEVVFFRYN